MQFRLISASIMALGLFSLSSCVRGKEEVRPEDPRETLPVQSKPQASLSSPEADAEIQKLCRDLTDSIRKYRWGIRPCGGINWVFQRKSIEGRPLIYATFGDPSSKNRTLIFSMVHPDEITPFYLGFQTARLLSENPASLSNAFVVVAPLVNPDGHFRKPPIRMNARGVDVNRNFATHDWPTQALQKWKGELKRNPRRFPGWEPSSEPETEFQEELIARFEPTKILSVHAPLNVTDYDGPSSLTLEKFPQEYVQECQKLKNRLRARSTGFFPGSLGNYAGQEMGIPTITLELPSADPRKAPVFYARFRSGIQAMIDFRIEGTEVARQIKRRRLQQP